MSQSLRGSFSPTLPYPLAILWPPLAISKMLYNHFLGNNFFLGRSQGLCPSLPIQN